VAVAVERALAALALVVEVTVAEAMVAEEGAEEMEDEEEEGEDHHSEHPLLLARIREPLPRHRERKLHLIEYDNTRQLLSHPAGVENCI
jgi:hypothetical protein